MEVCLLAQEHLGPNPNAKLKNGAGGAAIPGYMALCLQEHMPPDSDIVILEYRCRMHVQGACCRGFMLCCSSRQVHMTMLGLGQGHLQKSPLPPFSPPAIPNCAASTTIGTPSLR